MGHIFFELLNVALCKQDSLSRIASEEEWMILYEMSVKQTLVGVMFGGIERLPKEQRPPKSILLKWFAVTETIKASNDVLNKGCGGITAFFEQQGMHSCVLKGQGNAKLYPRPELRTSGDIDIWVWPENDIKISLDDRRRKIIELVRECGGPEHIVYHHIDFGKWNNIEVEVHFTPTWLHNPFKNVVLQQFIEDEAYASFNNTRDCDDGNGSFCVPTWELNVISQLIHIQHHLFQEGIGLRQVMDLYYLLHVERGVLASSKHKEMLCRLDLIKFTSALMWVLKDWFSLENKFLLVPPNKDLGQFLQKEIMSGGNFGHHHVGRQWSRFFLKRTCQRIARTWKFLKINPQEAIFIPMFKAWHYFWRKKWNYCCSVQP